MMVMSIIKISTNKQYGIITFMVTGLGFAKSTHAMYPVIHPKTNKNMKDKKKLGFIADFSPLFIKCHFFKDKAAVHIRKIITMSVTVIQTDSSPELGLESPLVRIGISQKLT